MKYNITDKSFAIFCNGEEEQKQVLAKIEEKHPDLKWFDGDVLTEWVPAKEIDDLKAYYYYHFGIVYKEDKEEALKIVEKTITASKYLNQFEENKIESVEEVLTRFKTHKDAIHETEFKIIKDAQKQMDNMVILLGFYQTSLDVLTSKAIKLSEKKLKELIKKISDI